MLLSSLLRSVGIKEIECSVSSNESGETKSGCLRMYSMKWVIMSRLKMVRCWFRELNERDDKMEDSDTMDLELRTGKMLATVRKRQATAYHEPMIERRTGKRK